MSPLRSVSTLWIGSPLGPYEQLCLLSFVQAGYAVDLFTFDDRFPIPAGVTRHDARDVLPAESVFENHFQRGTFAAYSNIFRYRLLQLQETVWVDTDVLCGGVKIPDSPYLFGWESNRIINGAVLAAPSSSPLLSYWHDRANAFPKMEVNWGDLGPKLITEGVERFELSAHAAPMSVFYPLAACDIWMLFDPRYREQIQSLRQRSATVHLWNEFLRTSSHQVKACRPPRESFLKTLFDDYDITPTTEQELSVRWVRGPWRRSLNPYRQRIHRRLSEGKHPVSRSSR